MELAKLDVSVNTGPLRRERHHRDVEISEKHRDYHGHLPFALRKGQGRVRYKMHMRIKGTPTLFKVIFYTEVVCQKIQHGPLVMLVT